MKDAFKHSVGSFRVSPPIVGVYDEKAGVKAFRPAAYLLFFSRHGVRGLRCEIEGQSCAAAEEAVRSNHH